MLRSFAFVVLAFPLLAFAAELPAPVRDALARVGVPLSAVGAIVVPVEGGTALVDHNAGKPLNPASTIKVITTYAGLDLLGPAFTFRTHFTVTGTITNGVLDGNLAIRGGGDPKLSYERLWQVAHSLRARGLREIRGDVILDRSYFAPAVHDPAKFDGESRRAYNVGPDALLINFKAVDFRFVPEGDGVRVMGEPDLPNVEIASSLKLVKEPCGAWRRGLKYDIVEMGLIATANFTGTYPASCGENTWPLSVFDADRYVESVFRWIWSEVGGTLLGKVRPGATPAEGRLLYMHESEPLASLVRDINKYSNNVMARQVFLTLSAEKAGVPGDAAASTRVVREWLKTKGIAAPELVLENGSGLSRAERASAATLAAVLRSAWASSVMPELISSFPVFAVDGTLKKRVGDAAGQAHLKGGTLTGVQSVAGYVLDSKGRRWVVVIVANHDNANRAQPAFDALVDWVQRGK
ncbi:D-alanyl-D-alanine carboxypeptidase/D-alanyl-D-alanine endopeptidase [Usitatibacter palustris]|uniref:D-alanyl-D-alanine carboxypeptidase DacB n=1 Tax=Usitatibacter palustris TaxID=2732487 RepID=A0A6M4HFD0_9PROT|nr:D-alanyl-D-alanine carboxypeptidase/D-alanyl-D-alanine-endopeptidase [Usitatibacter palustris]QJR16747.1 D-alanyl-D-alanine carboxypeptidase DacB [Usitatibacter palustris]